MKVVKNVFVAIITIILVLLFTFGIYNFVCIKILKQDYAAVGGYTILEVVSGSMEPTIHIGDLIVIDTKEKDYKPNDIVTFYDVEGSFVTHRILSIDGVDMITKGDNNDTEDEATPTDKLVGKYVFKVTGIGKLLASFRNPLVMAMVLLIGIIICYMISTDKEGKPILTEEEKEFEEFLEYQKKNNKKGKGEIKTPKVITNKNSATSGKKKGVVKNAKVTKTTSKETTSAKKVNNEKKKGVIKETKVVKSSVKKTLDKKKASSKGVKTASKKNTSKKEK